MHFTTIATISVTILGFASQNVFAVPVDSLDNVDYYDQGSSKVSKRGLDTAVGGLGNTVNNAVSGLTGGLGETIGDAGDGVGKFISDLINELAPIIVEILEGIAKNAGDAAGGATGNLP